jgi:hypothetical protein
MPGLNPSRFDQEENTAIMCVDLDDTDTIQNGRVGWYLLEDVLEAWRDMIEKGKVAAIPSGQCRRAMDDGSLQSINFARHPQCFQASGPGNRVAYA